MKYNGQELTPITTPQIFDPPKKMLVWDAEYQEPVIKPVCAITGSHYYQVITCRSCYGFCAEIPKQELKRATNIQLMEWLASGNGMWKKKSESYTFTNAPILEDLLENEVEEYILIRKFGDTEWLEPTLENMGMEE